MKPRVLLVDDDRSFAEDLVFHLGEQFDWEVRTSGRDVVDAVLALLPDVVLLDIDLGEGPDGFEILQQLRAEAVATPVIMVTRHDPRDMAARAWRLGAFGYLEKGARIEALTAQLTRAIEEAVLGRQNAALRDEVARHTGTLVGESSAMQELSDEIDRLATATSTVLITGETGTGKELVAREIHNRGPRRGRLFVPVCCPAIPAELVESELFGHEKGAFTSAVQRRIGKFELAHRGTLFLDEISELTPAVQAKLLRVLQDHRVVRVGGTSEMEIDVRVIAATNRDLAKMVETGAFREDLFYRLRVVPLTVPPLRDRRQDVPLLAAVLLERKARAMGRPPPELHDSALDLLVSWDWPGNVRELENALEYALVHSGGEALGEHLFLPLLGDRELTRLGFQEARKQAMERFDRDYLSHVLRTCGGNVSEAARRMDLTRQGVQKMIKRLGLRRPDSSDDS